MVADAHAPMENPNEAAEATLSVSHAIQPHSPIHNNVQRASYSFYLNWEKWKGVDHLVHVEAHSSSPRIAYQDLNYRIPPDIGKLITPNQFTYVRLCLPRNTDAAYALYQWDPTLQLSAMTWDADTAFPPGNLPL
jgi:hypothetical protein